MADIYRLSDELGVSSDDDNGITLWDMRNESPEKLEYIDADEMADLLTWYLDGRCPVCFDEIPLNDVICDSCFEEATNARY